MFTSITCTIPINVLNPINGPRFLGKGTQCMLNIRLKVLNISSIPTTNLARTIKLILRRFKLILRTLKYA